MKEDISESVNVLNLLIILLSNLWGQFDGETGELSPKGFDYLETTVAVAINYRSKLTDGDPMFITGIPAEILSEIESTGAQLQ